MEPEFSTIEVSLDRIRARLRERGLTQGWLADRMSLPQSAVSNMLRGKRGIKVEEWAIILESLDLLDQADHLVLPLVPIEHAAEWQNWADHDDWTLIDLPGSYAPTVRFAALYIDDGSMILPRGDLMLLINPVNPALFDGNIYLAQHGAAPPSLYHYAEQPARLVHIAKGERAEINIGMPGITILGEVTGVLRPPPAIISEIRN